MENMTASLDVIELAAQCPLLALGRHPWLHRTCPLLGVKRTLIRETTTSANDPKRTSCHGAKAGICLGLSIVVNRPGATCSDAVKADSPRRVGPRCAKRRLHAYPPPISRNKWPLLHAS